jgi:cation diffusion facilitator CzcD-associated flavoprotein CzcO
MIDYLESYAKLMKINICFDHELIEAKYNSEVKEWNLKLKLKKDNKTIDYTAKYLIIATGQNNRNRSVEPFPGQDQFQGKIIHASQYY